MPQQIAGDYQTLNTLETFGFLPKFSQDEIYAQINYIIAQGTGPCGNCRSSVKPIWVV